MPQDSPQPPDLEAIEREAHDALSKLLTRHGLMLTKWQLAAEVIAADGGRNFLSLTSPDHRPWDSIGLSGYADEMERASVVSVELDRDDGDS